MYLDLGPLASKTSDEMIQLNLFRFLSGIKVQFHLSRKNYRKFHSNGQLSESEASQQSCILKITVFFHFNFCKKKQKQNAKNCVKKDKAKLLPKCEPTPDWSVVVYMSWNAIAHATWSWLDIQLKRCVGVCFAAKCQESAVLTINGC